MKDTLLIADCEQQYYFEPFVQPSRDRGVRINIFDPTRFPTSASVRLKLDDQGQIDGYLDVLECQGETYLPKRLDIGQISAAWYLRATKPVPRNAMTELEARFAQSESQAALESIYSVLPCTWINRRETIRFLESNKLYQQLVAQKHGLRTPSTLITNDPAAVLNFETHNEQLLFKTLGYTKLDDAGKYFIYSQLFARTELQSLEEAIQACPVFSQSYIEKKFEYRVMVIGNRVLACRIDSQASEKTRVDWRHYDFDKVLHTRFELPVSVQRNLLAFMAAVKLRYGAIDLIETPDGEFTFLEVNPSGQWEWIKVLAGLPIPDAVAEMLAEVS